MDPNHPPPGRESRIRSDQVEIDYSATHRFFEGRAAKARTAAPMTAVLYQDSHPELALARDESERALVLPWLPLDGQPRVLDIGCGIGRWGRHLASWAACYQGVDFSEGLVEVAQRDLSTLYPAGRVDVMVMSAVDLTGERLRLAPPFDLVIQAGLLVYLNDDDVNQVLSRLPGLCAPGATIYMREPVAVADRLTLDRHWSAELSQEYSATYRTADFYRTVIDAALVPAGFIVERSVPLDPALANRSETTQHHFLLRRTRPG